MRSGLALWLDFMPLAQFEACETSQGTPPAIGGQALAGVRILIVDDSEINLDVTKRILELHGATVMPAGNGADALDMLRARPMEYDLVLMDVQMPVLDGLATTRMIRESLSLVALPVIALTAGGLGSERQRAAASGMDDFIIKPFDANGLVSSILRHVRRDLRAEAGDSRAIAGSFESRDGWPVLHGIDIEQARIRLAGDMNLFMSSLRRLLTEYADLEEPAGPPQMPLSGTYAQRMHKLKGMAAMMGAGIIERLARQGEAACKSANLVEASAIARQLSVELRRLRDSAAGVLEADPFVSCNPRPENGGAAVDAEQLARLVTLLESQDLGAVDLFNSMAAALRRHLGRQSFETVRGLVDRLKLTEAAAALGNPPS